MIAIQHLNMKFGKLQVLNNIDTELANGECIALIGPNGCGKTTLIKSILGMVLPTSGTIRFKGTDIQKQYQYRAKIGYMPQTGRYPEQITVQQLIRMLKEIRSEKEVKPDEDLLRQFELENMYHKKICTLSGGMVQKVSATIAFLFDPEVLILDEPTAGLDPLAAEILKEKILAEKQKGKLILITSHLLSELDDLVSQLIFMQEGRILFQQSITELQKQTGEEKIAKAITRILKQNKK
jgi:Cu-processing system ATP-binding protein